MVIGIGGRLSGGDQIDVKDPTGIKIEQSLIAFKPRLGNWILVNFEGTSLNFSIIFPLFLKFPLIFMNMVRRSFAYPTTK